MTTLELSQEFETESLLAQEEDVNSELEALREADMDRQLEDESQND